MKEVSAGGVVYRKNGDRTEVLLIRDRFGKVTLAKGKMEPGETPEQTALREIREETGIRGRLEGPLADVSYRYKTDRGETVHKEVRYFLVRAEGGALRPQEEEIAGAAWYTPEEAWRLQRSQGYGNNDEVLRRALARLGIDPEADSRFPVWRPGDPLAPFIDHTLLKADARAADIARLCEEAVAHRFYSVCVNGGWVRRCREWLKGSNVKVCAVVGFPLGAGTTRAKAFEAAAAVEDGAAEIDMVIAVGRLLDGDREAVERDMATVVQAVQGGALVKAILETSLLPDALKVEACRIAEAAGVDFVKTSTGFGPGGATEADVRLLRASVSPRIGVKASGGVRDASAAIRMLKAGANRIGTSAGVAIVKGAAKDAAKGASKGAAKGTSASPL